MAGGRRGGGSGSGGSGEWMVASGVCHVYHKVGMSERENGRKEGRRLMRMCWLMMMMPFCLFAIFFFKILYSW